MKKRRKAEGGRARERKGVQPRSAAMTPEGKALRESEAKFRSLVESAAVPICVSDLSGDIAYVNKAFADLGGYTVKELVGRPFMDFLHPEDREVVFNSFMKGVSTSEEAPEIEFRVKRRDGQILTLTSKPTRFEIDGKTAGCQAIITDITEHKRMEEEARISEERYRNLVENSKDSIVILDMKGNVVFGNKATRELTGYTLEEGVGMNVRDITPLRYWPRSLQMLLKARSGKPIPYFESIIKRKDGRLVPVETGGQAVIHDGKVVGLQVITRNITARKRMEEEIKSLARFPSENPNPVLRVDRHGVVLSANEASKALFASWSCEIGQVAPKSWVNLVADALSTGQSKNTDIECGGKAYTFLVNPIMESDYANLYGRDITERKHAEMALRESEERYRLIAENMTETIWLMDMNLKPTYISPSAVPLRGYTLEELYALPIDRQLTPDSLKLAWETFKEALSEENLNSKDAPTSITLELEFYRKDGSTFWNESTFTLVRNSKGEPAGILGVGREITERKRAEDALRRRAEELAALQATVLDITSRHDLAALLETIVERAARLLRVSSGGMYLCDPQKREARCVVAYKTPYSIKGTVLKYGEGAAGTVAETGKPLLVDDYRTWEGRAVAYEQTKPFIAVLGVPVIWQGQVMGVIDVLDDGPQHFTKADQELLTLFANHAAIAIENARLMEQEKRNAEELARHSTSLEQLVLERTGKLAESERRFRELADLLPQIVFEIDVKGDLTFVNRVAFAITGYTEEDLREGLNALQMVVPEDRNRVMENMRRILGGEVLPASEYVTLRKDGSTFPALFYSSRVIQSGKPVGLRGLVIDITERKRMEARLAESQRLAAIGETAAMVGHDLRNPLQGIVSTVYLAKRKLESPPEPSRNPVVKPGLVDMLETIENEVNYMDKIVSDLQDYAAPLKAEPRPVEMKPLVKDTLSKICIPQNVKVSFKVSEPLPTVMVDPAVMRRVFTNLITNAIQAMPDGGELGIDLHGTDESLFIAFKDTGAGIPEENMDKLFNPLFTTKAKGQGLGLPVCKRLVEACDGRITVESKPGEGSTFTVKLPLIKP